MDLTDITGNSDGRVMDHNQPRTLAPVEHDQKDPDVKPETGTQQERNETTAAPEGLWSFDAAIDGRDRVMISAPEDNEE